MMTSKIDPLADAVELLREINDYCASSETKDPVTIGCHCTDTGTGSMLVCVWCRVEAFLVLHKVKANS